MGSHEVKRHPGPWRVMRVDSEFAGLLLAVGFLVLGVLSMPIARVFVLGAIGLGVVLALLLRFVPRKFSRSVVGAVIILAPFVFWWSGHIPRRPHTVSSNALYVVPNNLPFRSRQPGYWLECWFDQHENVDRCKLTDERGAVSFEDVFLLWPDHEPLPQSELVLERKTGNEWVQSCDKRVNVPVVYVKYGQALVPQKLYAETSHEVRCSGV